MGTWGEWIERKNGKYMKEDTTRTGGKNSKEETTEKENWRHKVEDKFWRERISSRERVWAHKNILFFPRGKNKEEIPLLIIAHPTTIVLQGLFHGRMVISTLLVTLLKGICSRDVCAGRKKFQACKWGKQTST